MIGDETIEILGDRQAFSEAVTRALSTLLLDSISAEKFRAILADDYGKWRGYMEIAGNKQSYKVPESFPAIATSEDLVWFSQACRDQILRQQGAGGSALSFSSAILGVLSWAEAPDGRLAFRRLTESQHSLIKIACAVASEKPLPVIVWIEFVRRHVDDPSLIARCLAVCQQCALELMEKIKGRVRYSPHGLLVREPKKILVCGISHTVVATLVGIAAHDPKIRVVFLEGALDHRSFEAGEDLGKELQKLTHRENRSEIECLKMLARGEFGLVLMGAKVTGLTNNRSLEIVNSVSSGKFALQAFRQGVQVAAVTALFKCWPAETYEKYRQGIIADEQHNCVVPSSQVNWVVSELGVLNTRGFWNVVRNYPSVNDMPLLSLLDRLDRTQLLKIQDPERRFKVVVHAVREVAAISITQVSFKDLKRRVNEIKDLPLEYLDPEELYGILYATRQGESQDWRHLGKTTADLISDYYTQRKEQLWVAHTVGNPMSVLEHEAWIKAVYRQRHALECDSPGALEDRAAAIIAEANDFAERLDHAFASHYEK